MITEIIRYLITEDREKQFEEDYKKAGEYLDASPNCLGYALFRSEKEKSRYLLQIQWDSAEGHLQGFRQSPDFSKFFSLIRPYFNMIEEMEHYTKTSVVGDEK